MNDSGCTNSETYSNLFIKATADNHVMILTRLPESINKIQFEGSLPCRFCTASIWCALPAATLYQWLLYHHHLLGRDRIHYFFCTGIPLDSPMLHVL